MSKEILRPQKAQPAPVPLAHIVGEIDHTGKVWTPAQPAQQEPVAEFKSLGQRWEDGDEHDQQSETLYKFIADTDFKHFGDSFCFKSGGDGDNGETLMSILDCWFASTPPAAQRQPLTINEITAIEEKVYMQTTHKGKPAFEYAHALIRAVEAAHDIKEKNT